MDFEHKYLKYKKKYLELKGSGFGDIYDFTKRQKTYLEDDVIKDLQDKQFNSSKIKETKKFDDLYFIMTESKSIYILKNIIKPMNRLNRINKDDLKIYINHRIPFYDIITKELKDNYGGKVSIETIYEFNHITIYKKDANKWYIFDTEPLKLGYNNYSRFKRLQIEFINNKTNDDNLKKLFINKIDKMEGIINFNLNTGDKDFNLIFENTYKKLIDFL